MLHIRQTVIVEGKYDKIRLSNIIDARIITTGGFDIFTDEPKRKLLKKIAEKDGIIVLTDSDRAGFRIRNHIRGFLPAENVIQLFIPQKEGKEPRKDAPSKDGYLGVEGIDDAVLEALFAPYANDTPVCRNGFTKADMYEYGLCGREESASKRDRLSKILDLPVPMTSNAMLSALNMMFSKEEVISALGRISE